MRVAINGAAGRMGMLLVADVMEAEDLVLAGATDAAPGVASWVWVDPSTRATSVRNASAAATSTAVAVASALAAFAVLFALAVWPLPCGW